MMNESHNGAILFDYDWTASNESFLENEIVKCELLAFQLRKD